MRFNDFTPPLYRHYHHSYKKHILTNNGWWRNGANSMDLHCECAPKSPSLRTQGPKDNNAANNWSQCVQNSQLPRNAHISQCCLLATTHLGDTLCCTHPVQKCLEWLEIWNQAYSSSQPFYDREHTPRHSLNVLLKGTTLVNSPDKEFEAYRSPRNNWEFKANLIWRGPMLRPPSPMGAGIMKLLSTCRSAFNSSLCFAL